MTSASSIVKLLPTKTDKTPETTLVLDLDETLIHAHTDPTKPYDFTFALQEQAAPIQVSPYK